MAEGQNPRVFNPDGSMLKRNEAPPSRFTVLKKELNDRLDRFNAGFDRIFGGKKQSGGRPAGPMVRSPQVTDAMKAEIAGETHPGTDAPFVDVSDKPFDWKHDPELSATETDVTKLAAAATYDEIVAARKLGSAGAAVEQTPVAPPLKLVPQPKEDAQKPPTLPTPPEGPSAA